jgi:hypothetical protein
LRRRQLSALTAWSIAGARIQPLVLALEADPTSLERRKGGGQKA